MSTERYAFEFGYGEVWREGRVREQPARGHLIIDRKRGHDGGNALAFCAHVADAEKIVSALNAAERRSS
jgi:hypothetical protein